jgi:ribosomal protein L18E
MRLNTLSPAEGSKRRVNAWVVVSVLASVKPVVVVTKVRTLVLAVAYVAVSRVVRCLCTVVCRNSASLLVKQMITAEIRLSDLAQVEGDVVDLNTLKAANIIGIQIEFAKVILSGEVSTPVTVRGLRVTKGARAAIEAAGGKIEE